MLCCLAPQSLPPSKYMMALHCYNSGESLMASLCASLFLWQVFTVNRRDRCALPLYPYFCCYFAPPLIRGGLMSGQALFIPTETTSPSILRLAPLRSFRWNQNTQAWKQKSAKTDALPQNSLGGNGGSDRDWTCDPFDVNEVLSRWATPPHYFIWSAIKPA